MSSLGAPPDMPPGLSLLLAADLHGPLPRHILEAAIRARCHTVPLERNSVLCRVLGRYKFLVDSRDLGLAPHLMLDGFWEYWVTTFIARNLQPGMVALDVGANHGYYAVLMADLVGPQGRVLAVEPNPRMARLVTRNLALNGFAGRAILRRVAATDRSGDKLRFRVDIADPKNGHLLPADAPPSAAREGQVEEFLVQTMRLDELAPGRVDFIKIDVEGAEAAVWAGMPLLLDRNRAITVLLEFNAFRCADPACLLAGIASRFPLRELRDDSTVVDVAIGDLLLRQEDSLLVLSRTMFL